jgi:glycosyltransferase-like protein LARGE
VPRSADARALPFAERPDLFQELHARADAAAAATADPAAVPAPRFAAFAAAAAACADAPAAAAVPGGGPPLPPAAVPRAWRSARPRAVDDVTLVTNLDRGRLAMLADQCATWGGPLSAAVYLALDARAPPAERAAAAAELAAELAALHAVAEARAAGCALDLALVTEERLAEEMWAYPYNTMRNQALARAATRLVLLLDADFLVSDGFRDEALRPAAWAALLDATHARRQALVLPAFETRAGLELGAGAATAAAAAAADKRGLKRMFDGGDVTRFAPFYRRGHSATDYARWFASAAGYEVVPETGYEPYLLLSRLHVPWFDERFRGCVSIDI